MFLEATLCVFEQTEMSCPPRHPPLAGETRTQRLVLRPTGSSKIGRATSLNSLRRPAMVDERDNPVGYKRPPKHAQYKRGQSGNPTGRRKTVGNFKTDLVAELQERIPISENGREIKVTKRRAFVKALVAAAIRGDVRAINALVSLCTRSLGSEDEQDASPTAEDIDIIEAFIKRERQRSKPMEKKSTTPRKKG